MRARLLEQHFGSIHATWETPRADLLAAGLDESTVRSLLRTRGKVEPDQELEAIDRTGLAAFTWNDPGYPPRLKEIDEAPPMLFVQGTLEDRDEWSVAVVGTRRVSAYGRQMTEELSRGLATNSITVVSGLARGVDGIPHRAALDAGRFRPGHSLPAGTQGTGAADHRAGRRNLKTAAGHLAAGGLRPAPQPDSVRVDAGLLADQSGQGLRHAAYREPR